MKDLILHLLHKEVKPATGCTEPVAIALACAKLASVLKTNTPEELVVNLSPNIYKNAMGVGIPNMHKRGLVYSAAAGLQCAHFADAGLQVLTHLTPKMAQHAEAYAENAVVEIGLAPTNPRIYISAEGTYKGDRAKVWIQDAHDAIVGVELNGELIFDATALNKESDSKNQQDVVFDFDAFFKAPLKQIVEAIETLSYDELSFLKEGYTMNLSAAKQGLDSPLGLGIGYHTAKDMRPLEKNDSLSSIAGHAMMMTAAASDARMSGKNIPVMTSNGSGNNGLTAILPIIVYAENKNIHDEELVKAFAISHMVNCYIKSYIGKLAPVCSCAISAASGSSAAIAWLETKDMKVIEGTISNMIANLSGLVCDGAKEGCALKLATAAYTSVMGVMLSKAGVVAGRGNGIIGKSVEDSIRNLGVMSNEGMITMDQTLIQIMVSC